MPPTRTVLCYGDSNTWGYDPATRERFPPDARWTGVLAATLGADFRVVEEGLNGRTTVWDDPLSPGRNGRDYLPPCLETHRPFDAITIMLGTNDLKARFRRSASDIAEGAALLADIARTTRSTADGHPPAVLLIAPPPVLEVGDLAAMFAGAAEKSAAFAAHYRAFAGWYDGVAYLDAGAVIRSSPLDGIHFEAEEHRKLGVAVAAEVRRLLGA